MCTLPRLPVPGTRVPQTHVRRLLAGRTVVRMRINLYGCKSRPVSNKLMEIRARVCLILIESPRRDSLGTSTEYNMPSRSQATWIPCHLDSSAHSPCFRKSEKFADSQSKSKWAVPARDRPSLRNIIFIRRCLFRYRIHNY